MCWYLYDSVHIILSYIFFCSLTVFFSFLKSYLPLLFYSVLLVVVLGGAFAMKWSTHMPSSPPPPNFIFHCAFDLYFLTFILFYMSQSSQYAYVVFVLLHTLRFTIAIRNKRAEHREKKHITSKLLVMKFSVFAHVRVISYCFAI